MSRVQRVRGKPLPPNTVYVGRPSRWGNPFPLGSFLVLEGYDSRDRHTSVAVGEATREQVITGYRAWLRDRLYYEPSFLEPLVGKNLACYCPLDEACHVDVLLEALG